LRGTPRFEDSARSDKFGVTITENA
jgi:hypothetical protein